MSAIGHHVGRLEVGKNGDRDTIEAIPFDLDGDGDVDVADLGGFQRAFTGLP